MHGKGTRSGRFLAALGGRRSPACRGLARSSKYLAQQHLVALDAIVKVDGGFMYRAAPGRSDRRRDARFFGGPPIPPSGNPPMNLMAYRLPRENRRARPAVVSYERSSMNDTVLAFVLT